MVQFFFCQKSNTIQLLARISFIIPAASEMLLQIAWKRDPPTPHTNLFSEKNSSSCQKSCLGPSLPSLIEMCWNKGCYQALLLASFYSFLRSSGHTSAKEAAGSMAFQDVNTELIASCSFGLYFHKEIKSWVPFLWTGVTFCTAKRNVRLRNSCFSVELMQVLASWLREGN